MAVTVTEQLNPFGNKIIQDTVGNQSICQQYYWRWKSLYGRD